MKITGVTVFPVNLPLKQTFRTALGSKENHKNVWVRTTAANIFPVTAKHPYRWPSHASQDNMCRAISDARSALLGVRFDEWEPLALSLKKKFRGMVTALSAVECALLDLYCRAKNISAAQYFGAHSDKLETFYTIPAIAPAVCVRMVRNLVTHKFTKFKIKVTGSEPDADLLRVKNICNTVGVQEVIIDANQGWSTDSCLRFLDSLSKVKARVTLLEQPLPKTDIRGLAFLKKRSDIPIAVDESFNSLDSARRIVESGAADVFNIKLAKCGLVESLRMPVTCKKQRKRL